MIKPWELLDNGQPVADLPPAIEMGILAYQAYISSHRSLDDDGITIVPFDESIRRFIHGILTAGGGHKEMMWLIEQGVMDRGDIFTWTDVVAERFEMSDL